jgi:hypothetical protein
MTSKTPRGKAALAKRQKERADLQGQKIIWVGLAMTEANIQRLGKLLLFAEWPAEEEPFVDQMADILPYDGFEADQKAVPEIEFNYEMIRRDITNALSEILTADESLKPRLKALIQEHGGERLPLVPEKNLPELYVAINRVREETV